MDPNTHSDVLEAHADNKVGGPVGESGHSHSSRSGALGEELGDEEPGDRTRTHFKEAHEAKDGQHADVAHPGNPVLPGTRLKGSLSVS